MKKEGETKRLHRDVVEKEVVEVEEDTDEELRIES